MPTLFFDLEDFDEDEDSELYEKEDLEVVLPDLDADEDDVLCKQCGEIVEDGVQCSFCGWIVEIVKGEVEDIR